jgi:hypothetical protein
MPIALPNRAMSLALPLIAEEKDDAALEQRLRDLVRDNDGDPAALDQLSALLPAVYGRGQAGATRRSGTGGVVRAGSELSWLDGPQGRVRVSGASAGWVSVNSLHPKTFRAEFDAIVATARSAD